MRLSKTISITFPSNVDMKTYILSDILNIGLREYSFGNQNFGEMDLLLLDAEPVEGENEGILFSIRSDDNEE